MKPKRKKEVTRLPQVIAKATLLIIVRVSIDATSDLIVKFEKEKGGSSVDQTFLLIPNAEVPSYFGNRWSFKR